MFLHNRKTIEYYLLENLKYGPLPTMELIECIRKDKPDVSKQAIYAKIRTLKTRNVLVTHNKQVYLNADWLQKLIDYTNTIQHSYYNGEIGAGRFFNLNDGERKHAVLNNPVTLYGYWINMLYTLMNVIEKPEPIYFYDDHMWFLPAEGKSEKRFVQAANNRGFKVFELCAQNNPLDKNLLKQNDDVYDQHFILQQPLFPRNNYYVSIVGNFVIEIQLGQKMADRIDHFFTEKSSPDDTTLAELQQILEKRSRIKLTVSKNIKKAEALKKKFSKWFYLPKE